MYKTWNMQIVRVESEGIGCYTRYDLTKIYMTIYISENSENHYPRCWRCVEGDAVGLGTRPRHREGRVMNIREGIFGPQRG